MRRKIAWLLVLMVLGALMPGVARSDTGPVLNPDNGHEYLLVMTAGLTWQQAEQAAEDLGGYLATITSQAEQDFIINTFPEAYAGRIWIGGFQANDDPDANPAGEWEWVTGEPWGYANWHPTQPSDGAGTEDVLIIWHEGVWNDCTDDCIAHGYIVEFEPTPPPPPPPPVVRVTINIKPNSWPNSGNLRGQFPVAILTTPTFDATRVDVSTVRFGPVEVLDAGGGGTELHGHGHLEDSYESDDRTKDGDIDMVLHFGARESGLTLTTTEACVRGMTIDGLAFEGCDAIRVRGR